MDQLKVFYRHCREHWFWISCGSIFLVGLAVWFTVTLLLSSTAEERRQKLAGDFSMAQQVAVTGEEVPGYSGRYHPNTITQAKMKEEIGILQQSVLKAWFEQQKNQGERVFAWPTELDETFRKAVEEIITRERPDGSRERIPIEMAIQDPNGRERLTIDDRITYGSYIASELPKLAKRISSNWSAGDEMARPGVQASSAPKPIVWWDPQNQRDLEERFNWAGEQGRNAPTTLQVLYSQEDLRVLESIMDIIHATNKDATADFNAAIKRIEYIELGRNASHRAGSVMRLKAAAGATPDENAENMPGGVVGGGPEPGNLDNGGPEPGNLAGNAPPEPGAPATANSKDPADLRYVDLDYQPLPADTLRKSFNQPEGSVVMDDNAARLAVAKRLPVRIKLTIDQRKLHMLLVECGNSPLTVEVRQVRINPPTGASSQRQGDDNDDGDPWGQLGKGFGGEQDNFGGNNQRKKQVVKDKNTQYDVTVELYGIVYIYNPVEKAILGPDQSPQQADNVAGNVAVSTPR